MEIDYQFDKNGQTSLYKRWPSIGGITWSRIPRPEPGTTDYPVSVSPRSWLFGARAPNSAIGLEHVIGWAELRSSTHPHTTHGMITMVLDIYIRMQTGDPLVDDLLRLLMNNGSLVWKKGGVVGRHFIVLVRRRSDINMFGLVTASCQPFVVDYVRVLSR